MEFSSQLNDQLTQPPYISHKNCFVQAPTYDQN